MKRRIDRDRILEEVKFLRENKIPFTFTVNNHTYGVSSNYGSYFCSANKIPMRELHFIKMVRDYVTNSKINKRIKNDFPRNKKGQRVYNHIKYFNYHEYKKSVFFDKDIYEIDINAAYWETALKLTIINEHLFKHGLNVQKKTRLAALGSLAKQTKFFKYDGATDMKWDHTDRKRTEYLWYKICEHLGNVMWRAQHACGNNFLFYWVDGIYVRGLDAAAAVAESFEKDGYKYKIRKINWIDFDLKKEELRVDDNIDKTRTFPLTTPKFKLTKSKRFLLSLKPTGI